MVLVNGGYLHYTDMKKFLKNLLLWNHRSDFKTISQRFSLGHPFQILFGKFWLVDRHALVNRALYGHEDILENYSSLKPLDGYWNNFIELFRGWSFSNIVREILFRQEMWLWLIGLLALYGYKEILLSSFLLNRRFKKIAVVLSNIQVSHQGPSLPFCYIKFELVAQFSICFCERIIIFIVQADLCSDWISFLSTS